MIYNYLKTYSVSILSHQDHAFEKALALHVAQIRMVNIKKKIVNADKIVEDKELTYTARGKAKQ